MSAGETHKLSDTAGLRVFANPERMRVLAIVRNLGPCTVGKVCEVTGLAPGSASYHLRRLSEAGLVMRSDSDEDRRKSWWSAPDSGVEEVCDGDSDTGERIVLRRATERSLDAAYSRYLDVYDSLDPQWRNAELGYDAVLELTPGELSELGDELVSVVKRWAERPSKDDDADGKRKVSLSLRGFPWEP